MVIWFLAGLTLAGCGGGSVQKQAPPPPQALTINTFRIPFAKLNSPYMAALSVLPTGVAPYSWSITGLPSGLSADSAGVISGSPTLLGSFTLGVTVNDSSVPAATGITSSTLIVYDGSLPGSIDQSFFGINLRDLSGTNGVPQVGVDQSPFGLMRLWDTQTMWLNLEPSANTFSFDSPAANSMDGFVAYAQANGVTVLYDVGQTPNWASSRPGDTSCKYANGACDAPSDWNQGDTLFKTYMTTLVQRYNSSATSSNPQTGCSATNPQCHGVIGMYELWNEPSVSSEWNPGQMSQGNNISMAAFIQITNDAYDIIRSIDPNAKIVSPSGYLPWMDTSYWANGGIGGLNNTGRHFDYISIHEYSYVGKHASFVPEQMVGQKTAWNKTFIKYGIKTPTANTEGSWGAKVPRNITTDTQKQEYIARYMLLNAGLQNQMIVWDTWNGSLGDSSNGTLKPAGTTFHYVGNWLLGARVTSAGCLDSTGKLGDFTTCSPMGGNNTATYVINLAKPSGTAQAVWYLEFDNGSANWDATTSYLVPPQFAACQNAHDGSACSLKPGSAGHNATSHMPIGAEPMLFMTSGYSLP